ncbi:hypothetical protein NM688_g4249 [Phlebia brevispora]|uniref:Uncharacterized protein n=1 Tax=Phlebia brevispora TaxID=194682 RepID=A0ACC1T424_9APHY|nr:hypothetical protein NM688_g4249 [Phlebia brevispora]
MHMQVDMYTTVQQAILNAIDAPQFSAALPPLSDASWLKILGKHPGSHFENERLEFLGDALMYATLGIQLYSQLPEAGPGLFTCVRSALHSNVTFSRLAEKLDIFAVNDQVLKALTAKTFGEGANAPAKSRPQVKATADLFETVIGMYFLDCGFKKLCRWVDELYSPLITIAEQAYVECRRVRLGKCVGANTSIVVYTRSGAKKAQHHTIITRSSNHRQLIVPPAPYRTDQSTPQGTSTPSCSRSIIDLTSISDDDDTLLDNNPGDASIVVQRSSSVQSHLDKYKAITPGKFAMPTLRTSVSFGDSVDMSISDEELEDILLGDINSDMEVDSSLNVDSDSESEKNGNPTASVILVGD